MCKSAKLKYRRKLMWLYCEQIGSDSILGLHVCDDFLQWEKDYKVAKISVRASRSANEGSGLVVEKAWEELTCIS